MDGSKSPSGNIPNINSHPATPSQSPTESQSGVNRHTGQRYTPASESKPAGISIHMRNPRIQTGVLPRVNREKAIEQLQSSYKTHYAQAEAQRDQLELAHSLKEIRHYLDNPALAKECTSFSIMWIPDDGEPVSVIPPGTELNDRNKATEIRGMLHGQLDKLDKKFTVSKLQQLGEKIAEEEGLMQLNAQRLYDIGGTLPKFPPRERMVFLGGNSAKMPSIPGQSSTPGILPETGQHTYSSSPTTPVTPQSMPVEPSEDIHEDPALSGRFELRLKKTGMPLSKPAVEDEGDNEFLDGFGGELASPKTESIPALFRDSITEPSGRPWPGEDEPSGRLWPEEAELPGRPWPEEAELSGRPWPGEAELSGRPWPGEDELLFGSPEQQKEKQRLISIDDELDEESNPLIPSSIKREPPSKSIYEHPSEIVRPRARPKKTVPDTASSLSVPLSDRVPAPQGVVPLTQLCSVAYLPTGENAREPEVFLPKADFIDSEPMASVNPGDPKLGLAQEKQEVPNDTGLQFTRVLSSRGDIDKYSSFHHKMLAQCSSVNTYYSATEADLVDSPGLIACRVFRSDINDKNENTGTIIIDVFKDNFPENNSANQAMIYVVPPNADDYDDPNKFLSDCDETARRLTWILQNYNTEVRELHEAGKGMDLKEIPTLRIGVFSARQTKFPNINALDIANRITSGINYQMNYMYREEKRPQTIQKVEFQYTDGVFSKQAVYPTAVLSPQQAPVSEPPAPPSVTVQKLQECPPEVGKKIDSNMGQYGHEAKLSTHTKTLWDTTANPNPVYNGPLHSARKAMLTRAMVNFHRKHAMDLQTQSNDARFIPDSVVPAIELGVLSTKPATHVVLRSSGTIGQHGKTKKDLMQKNVPEGAAHVIATATTGYQATPDSNLLDSILKDVETMELMRASAGLDISQLKVYELYPDASAREELKELCAEYYLMMQRQGDLPPLAGKDTNAPTVFYLTENDATFAKIFNRNINPELRQHLAQRGDYYLHQVNQLKVAAIDPDEAVSPDLTAEFPPLYKSALKTFGELYMYSQDKK